MSAGFPPTPRPLGQVSADRVNRGILAFATGAAGQDAGPTASTTLYSAFDRRDLFPSLNLLPGPRWIGPISAHFARRDRQSPACWGQKVVLHFLGPGFLIGSDGITTLTRGRKKCANLSFSPFFQPRSAPVWAMTANVPLSAPLPVQSLQQQPMATFLPVQSRAVPLARSATRSPTSAAKATRRPQRGAFHETAIRGISSGGRLSFNYPR